MNLRKIANSVTQKVNPNIDVVWRRSTGYTTDANYRRIPSYDEKTVRGQVQALSSTDLKHVDALNITGIMRSVHLYGDVEAINRQNQQGGDLLYFPQTPGGVLCEWLVSTVMETWPDWCRVIATLQISSTETP